MNRASEPDKLQSLWLLQVDISSHSKWVAESPSAPDTMATRCELAINISNELAKFNLERAFWAGDGGLYYASRENTVQNIVDAGIHIIELFDLWRERFKAQMLGIRAIAHRDDDIYTHEEAGYWFSQELNAFMKYERDLTNPNSFVVTDRVYSNLTGTAQSKLPYHKKIQIRGHREWLLYSTDPWHGISEHNLEILAEMISELISGESGLAELDLAMLSDSVGIELEICRKGCESIALRGDFKILQKSSKSDEILIYLKDPNF